MIDARQALLTFLDEKVFVPALNAVPAQPSERKLLLRVQDRVRSTRLKYWEEYGSAEAVKANFLSDLHSPFGQDLAGDMFMLRMTRFEDVKDEFLKLCRNEGV